MVQIEIYTVNMDDGNQMYVDGESRKDIITASEGFAFVLELMEIDDGVFVKVRTRDLNRCHITTVSPYRIGDLVETNPQPVN